MEFFKKVFNIYLYRIIFWLGVIAILLCLLWYFRESNEKLATLLGGVTTGLFVGWLQLLLMATEHREIEKIKKLGIKEILPYRDDEEFYRKVIEKTKKEIRILGSTAFRFMNDFANENREDKKSLINALDRKVLVKFLLPEPNFLWNKDDKARANTALKTIQKLKTQYGQLVECKHYSHQPFHNLLLADNVCFVGPIFPNRTSKDTPTIYTDINSIFAQSYIEYFDYEWKSAKPCLQTQRL
jgi:hypothetical protein